MGHDNDSNAEECDWLLPIGMTKSSLLTSGYSGDSTKHIGNVPALKNAEHL